MVNGEYANLLARFQLATEPPIIEDDNDVTAIVVTELAEDTVHAWQTARNFDTVRYNRLPDAGRRRFFYEVMMRDVRALKSLIARVFIKDMDVIVHVIEMLSLLSEVYRYGDEPLVPARVPRLLSFARCELSEAPVYVRFRPHMFERALTMTFYEAPVARYGHRTEIESVFRHIHDYLSNATLGQIQTPSIRDLAQADERGIASKTPVYIEMAHLLDPDETAKYIQHVDVSYLPDTHWAYACCVLPWLDALEPTKLTLSCAATSVSGFHRALSMAKHVCLCAPDVATFDAYKRCSAECHNIERPNKDVISALERVGMSSVADTTLELTGACCVRSVLRYVPSNVSDLRLDRCCLGYNCLSDLVSRELREPRLHSLTLSLSPCNTSVWATLSVLSKMTTLRRLTLKRDSRATRCDDCSTRWCNTETMVAAICSLRHIDELDVSDLTFLDMDTCKTLSRRLRHLSVLRFPVTFYETMYRGMSKHRRNRKRGRRVDLNSATTDTLPVTL